MDKIWLASYPEGVPADVDLSQVASLVEILEQAYARFADRTAYLCMGASLTFGDVDRLSRAVAAWLAARGLGPGHRVAIMAPNVLSYPPILAGIVRAGCTLVSVNPLYTPRELQHQLRDSGAEAIFVLENFAHTVQATQCPELRHVVVSSMGDLMGFPRSMMVNFVVRSVRKLVPDFELPGHTRLSEVLREGATLPFQRIAPAPDDIALLQYTGGTTGVSKGAMLLQRNMVANVLQVEAWIRRRIDAEHQSRFVCALPLYHIFALTLCGFIGTRLGACNLLIPNPRDMAGFIKSLRGFHAHLFPGVNTLFNGLLNQPDFASLDFSDLRITIGGGMAVQSTVAERWRKLTGVPLAEGYGLSETSPVATCNPCDVMEYTGSIGLPVPSTEVAIRDDEGHDLPLGQPGEICIRGPQVMAGYWKQPAETARVMTADGFFRSGDIGVMDAGGWVRIVDRKKDMILVSGFNVYPAEVEEVVSQHPGVLECVVVGVPSEQSGEAVKVVVVRRDPALDEQAIRDWCHERLTGYKRPAVVEFRTELPKTNVGKVLRRVLRDEARQKQAAD
ncbi:MAG: long-chain-fatty-acid--CoA ligase [Pseudomonadota bacterium]|nr:long-chain-fatty-acid--CoA ligase [Pseudomonadota bacterium]